MLLICDATGLLAGLQFLQDSSVVSHFAKHLRGVLVNHLLSRRGAAPPDPRALLRAARSLTRAGVIKGAELAPPVRPGASSVLTLLVPEQR